MSYKIIPQVQDGYSYEGFQPDLEVRLCGGCGIMWGAPVSWLERRRRDGQTFYCPNGCPRSYRKTEEDRLRERLAAEQNETARLQASEDRLRAEVKHIEARRRATKAALTKTRKRIHAGVCPHCTRHFDDLERHMATKHADKIDGEEVLG